MAARRDDSRSWNRIQQCEDFFSSFRTFLQSRRKKRSRIQTKEAIRRDGAGLVQEETERVFPAGIGSPHVGHAGLPCGARPVRLAARAGNGRDGVAVRFLGPVEPVFLEAERLLRRVA